MSTPNQTGSFALNPSTGELAISREAYPIFGFDSAGDTATCQMVVARMHPDDRDHAAKTAERAFRDGTSLEGDYRILLPGGDIRHVHYIAHQVVSTTGRTKEYVGTLLDLTSQKEGEAALDPALRTLTPRERQIVPLVAEARSTKQIAFQLGICAKTVEAHRTHIMKKLGLHSASELVRYAISNGLVEL